MNLDEMLAASGISGGAAAVKGKYKIGLCNICGTSECREIDTDEPVNWTENCDYIQ